MESHNSDGVVGLGVKQQTIESFPCKKMMMVDHDNHHPSFSSSSEGGGVGPTCNNSGASYIYDVVAGVSGAAASVSGGAVGVRTLQPFDIFPTITATAHTAFKSPAGGMAATLGFPFTNAQWKELERQAMIYKYMMASVPVPPDLLLPVTTRNLSSVGGGALSLRFSGSVDLEPGRCRRTDGKKWRCSRDVAPDQKYCERHMHRGRPRSRKPVEPHVNNINSSKKTRYNQALPSSPVTVAISKPTINNNVSASQFLGCTTQAYHQAPVFLDKSNDKAGTFQPVVSGSSYKEPRSLDWMMKEPVPIATSDQQWHNLMQTKIGQTAESSFYNTNSSAFPQHYPEEPLNLNSYTINFGAAEDPQNNECALFLNPDVVPLEKPRTDTPRGFIDAWSNTVTGGNIANTSKNISASSNGKLSLSSSLALSMGGNNSIDEEMGQIEMGLGVIESNQNNECGVKANCSSWLSSASWVSCAPGGPLAEVLRPSTVTAIAETTSNPSSPIAGNGDSGGSLASTVSSPSGVLHKTLASLSDSSGSSSPTLASSRARPGIMFQWLNQSKLATS